MDQQPKTSNLSPILTLPSPITHIEQSQQTPNFYLCSPSSLHTLDTVTQSISHTLPLPHPRTTSLRVSPSLIITAGTDSKVCLYDIRSYQPIHTFNRVPSKFQSLDISEHILVGATNSNLVFWDLRKMKQRAQFRDSFNDDVVCVKFQQQVSTNLYACSVDGMINMFSLTQPNQQQSFQWCHKLLQSPINLTPGCTNTLLSQTSQHSLYKINQCDLIGKISPNNIQNPKHILASKFMNNTNFQQYEYYCWSQNKNQIEKWVGVFQDKNNEEKCSGGIWDLSGVVEVFGVDRDGGFALFSDDHGKVYMEKFGTKRKERKSSDHGHHNHIQNQNIEVSGQKWKFSKKGQQKQQGNKTVTKNGYVLQKPVSSFAKHKNFKPY